MIFPRTRNRLCVFYKNSLYKRSFSTQTTPQSELNVGDRFHGSYHWIYERTLSVLSLLTLSCGAVAGPSPGLDLALATIVPLHCHIGFGAIIEDYLPKRKFNRVNSFARWGLIGLTGLTIYGAYRFNTENIGISEAIATWWRAKCAYKELTFDLEADN
jgi:hypothetical protein